MHLQALIYRCVYNNVVFVQYRDSSLAIEKLEEEVYELREMLLQSKLDAELLLEKDLKKKLKISKMCERLLSSLKNQYEQLNEEKRELRAVYDTKVKAVAAEDMEELIEVR